MTDPYPLAAAIADLEGRRATLGDAVVDAAVAALRAQMAAGGGGSGGAATPASPAAAGDNAKLRQLSILFVDVADSTAMLGALSPDEALEVISAALERFAEVVRREGGEVLRFTGDGLKAAFGARDSQEDHAERAVRAGLGMLEAAREHALRLRASHAVGQFGIRVGVHTGMVVLGAGAEAAHGAMGPAVHLAARMEQSAPVGRLRISHDTWALVRGLFRVEVQPPLQVKGHDEPLRTYLVLDAVADPERAAQRGLEGVLPRMIGRDRELATLHGLFEAVRSDRRAAVACVVAEAGVGKTRLRSEFLQAIRRSAGPAPLLLQARAHPSSVLLPYGLVRQLLTRWLEIADDLDGETARTRFVAALAARLGPSGSMSVLAPELRAERLGHLLGLEFDHRAAVTALGAGELREQGLETLAELLAAEAEMAPVVIALDDLQWADAASLDLVRRLAQRPDLPVLWLLLTRPDGEPLAPGGATVLRLSPLGPREAAALADALLAAVDRPVAALRETLVARAGGNPFFMEELIRALIDHGAIITGTTPWQVRDDLLDTARLPQTLIGLLQARIDAMPAQERSALQWASVIGLVFWDEALAVLDPQAPAVLPALRRSGAVVERERSAFARATEFGFQHPLLHEVAHATVLSRQRRDGHARVACWLESRCAGREREFTALIAHHYDLAGDGERALDHYERARADAGSRQAHHETLKLIDRMLAQPALTDRTWRFQLQMGRHTALRHLGRNEEAAAVKDALRAYAHECDDDAMRADLLSADMLEADHAGRPDDARALAQRILELSGRAAGSSAAGPASLAHGELAWLALQRGDHPAVEHHLTQGIEQARRCAALSGREGGYGGYEIQLRLIGIQALLTQDRLPECLRAITEAFRSLELGDRPYLHDRFHLLMVRGRCQLRLGRVTDAQVTVDELTTLAEAVQMPRLMIHAQQLMASAALFRGEAAAAALHAARGEAIARASGHDSTLPELLRLRGTAALRQGQADVALAAWDNALALSLERGLTQEALALRCLRAALLEPRERLLQIQVAVDEAAANPLADWRALDAESAVQAWEVLHEASDRRAPALQAALRRRLAGLTRPLTPAERATLLDAVPWWRAFAAHPESSS